MERPNTVVVRAFIDAGSSRPTTGPEFIEFWKNVSMEDRVRYGTEARALGAE